MRQFIKFQPNVLPLVVGRIGMATIVSHTARKKNVVDTLGNAMPDHCDAHHQISNDFIPSLFFPNSMPFTGSNWQGLAGYLVFLLLLFPAFRLGKAVARVKGRQKQEKQDEGGQSGHRCLEEEF